MTDETKEAIDADIDLYLARLMRQATLIVGDDVESTREYIRARLAGVAVEFVNRRSICET